MFKRLFIIAVLLITISFTLRAQEKTRKVYRPDIPGYFMIDIGINNGQNKPVNFNQGFWGSRTLNLYYHYPVHIANSKFSYNPGGGFSFERFKFTNNYTLLQTSGTTDGSVNLLDPTQSIFQGGSVKKSMLISNYFDIMPIEFRFDTNPKDVTRGFNVTVGGRVGFLMESHTKLKYTENGVSGTYKDKQQHGLNPIRYGVYTRLGIGNFNWFAFYNLSPYFATNKGPSSSNTDLSHTTMNTLTVGISLNGF